MVLLCAFFQKIVHTERVGVQDFQKDLHPLDLGAKSRRKGVGRWLMAADVIHHSSQTRQEGRGSLSGGYVPVEHVEWRRCHIEEMEGEGKVIGKLAKVVLNLTKAVCHDIKEVFKGILQRRWGRQGMALGDTKLSSLTKHKYGRQRRRSPRHCP